MTGTIIAIAPEDDAASFADRLEWANASRVVAELPPGFALDEVGWMRIKRAADKVGCALAIATRDARQRSAAHEVGLFAFGSADKAAASAWLARDDIAPVVRIGRQPRRFRPNSLRRLFPARNWLSIGVRILVALATVAIIGGAVLTMIPTAKITVSASSQVIQTIVPVSLTLQRETASVEKRIVPAKRVDVIIEDTLGTPTSGEKTIPTFKARGTVTFFNVLSTPYKVPRDTVLRASASSSAARFVTLAEVEVPPGGQASAQIEAIDVGGEGNVSPNTINVVEGVPAIAVRVSNEVGTAGGGGTTVRATTQEDFRRLRAELRRRLLSRAAAEMLKDPDVAQEGLYVIPESVYIADVQDETFDRFVTEEANELKLTLRMQVAGLAVSPKDLDDIARSALASKAPRGFELLSARAERGDVAEEGTGTRVEYYMVARGIAGAAIDENALKKLIRGQTPDEARRTLQSAYRLNGAPTIEISPEWLPAALTRLPLAPMQIDVTVKRE
jgi:hypothetical protein